MHWRLGFSFKSEGKIAKPVHETMYQQLGWKPSCCERLPFALRFHFLFLILSPSPYGSPAHLEQADGCKEGE